MSNFEYASYSSSSSGGLGGGAGGVDVNGIFSQVDTNKDGTIDRGEFSNFVGNQLGGGVGGAGGSYGASSYESSSYSATGGADAGFAGLGGASSFESSGYGAGAGLEAGALGGASYQSSSFESSSTGGAVGFDATAVSQAASYTSETNAAWSRYGAEVTGAGLYVDANPQIIRRQAVGGVQTYTQNIKVRFLQPPPVPPPGVSYIYYSFFL
jgi:hypothetical protein